MSNNVEQKQAGLKTLNQINKLPIVNSACTTAVSYYNIVKNSHSVVKLSCNVTEYSYNIAAAITSPVLFYVCAKPIESIDNFLSEKLKAIEVSFPFIAKPTEQMYAETKEQVESIYSKNLKTKVETAKTVIKYGADKVSEAKKFTENVYNSTLKAPVNAVTI